MTKEEQERSRSILPTRGAMLFSLSSSREPPLAFFCSAFLAALSSPLLSRLAFLVDLVEFCPQRWSRDLLSLFSSRLSRLVQLFPQIRSRLARRAFLFSQSIPRLSRLAFLAFLSFSRKVFLAKLHLTRHGAPAKLRGRAKVICGHLSCLSDDGVRVLERNLAARFLRGTRKAL